jgi:serine-type D-Ala-D-Ala carboxypeptidase/endopeptidase
MRIATGTSAQITGRGVIPIFAETETDFYYRAVDAVLRFERGVDGSVAAVVLTQAGRQTRLERTR